MSREVTSVFLAIATVCGAAAQAVAAGPKGNEPPMLAYYYTWYTTGFGPHKHWAQWEKAAPSALYPQGCDADRFIFPPAIRQITSCAYPLIGPYDSDNRDVVRWHIQLCKAAGI
ncbi:MAG: hypothetical protein JXA69_05145, partial [Phycisphaerae bacterium]|nr:hypothetical protein [Phycisphaerae bacterium]